ncbi:MAG TPA: hypothetical protein VJM50_23930 [Pyrinomonadaceae bacterium]|nr:hypothetical protein [Pyrinomonadaceae bacterium]
MMADGHLNKCKACTKSDVAAHREKNIDAVRKYDRDRASRTARRELTTRVTAEYRARYPERVAANNALARAVKAGRIVQPPACWHCGSDMGVCGHHASYARDMRLAVSWLCQACHKAVHEISEQGA